MDFKHLSGINVNDIISGVAADTTGAGAIGGYCEENFPFFFANQAMVDMLGYDDLDDFVAGIGGYVGNTIHPDDLPQVSADLGDEYYEGLVYETTYRMPRKDGSWFWTVDRGEVIRTEDGRLAIISVCQDMTEFMHRQAELERKSFLNESMMNSLPGGYHRCAADENYTFLYTSKRFKELLGWTDEELEERFDNKFLNLVHPDDRKLTVAYVRRLEDGSNDKYQDSVYRLACKEGGYRWFTDASLECEVDGKRFFQGFITDITPYILERDEREEQMRQAMNEAERANAYKTSFLRHMSHDIRTPLNGILGMLEIVRRYEDDPDKRSECRQKMLEATNYLLSLVDNILDMNKLESGAIELDEKPFDMIEVLMENVGLIESQAIEAGVSYCGGKELSIVNHRYLVGSPTHLNRVLMNLATNAIKYNKPGGSVCVYCTEQACDGKTVVYRFVCEDTGIGMSEEFQERAFEVFAQEHRESSAGLSGTGLGLAIVKELVGLMGGSIKLESKLGVGTRFTVDIPFALDLNHREQAVFSGAALDLSGKRALLVEDNDLNLEIAQVMLEDMGLVVDAARDGREALEAFDASKPGTYSFIFMDIMMPVMGGLEAARRIRKLAREDAQSVVILAMTANAFQDDVRASIDAGMNGHITKPLNGKSIESAIAAAIG